MTLSEGYLERARASYEDAEHSYERSDWALVIGRSAEVVEYSLKAVLRYLQADYEREHDVSTTFLKHETYGQLPLWFQARVARIRMISDVLFRIRRLANYGDEGLSIPARDIFSQTEAFAYLEDAKEVYTACVQLVRALSGDTTPGSTV